MADEHLDMTGEDKALLLNAWKQAVDVQMHFNDLELRIRNFAFVLTGAFLALGGYALRDGGKIEIALIGAEISLASAILIASILPLLGFYFMDRWWYHPLLEGAVAEGAILERELAKNGIPVALGQNISSKSGMLNWGLGEVKKFSEAERDQHEAEAKRSPFNVWQPSGDKFVLRNGFFLKRTFRSKHKMMVFYSILIASMLGLAFVLKDVDRSPVKPKATVIDVKSDA
ncbi:MAG: hypothetical protein AAGH38_08565 [Pseudomonadota bacterium]